MSPLLFVAMNTNTYTLDELAAETGIEPRTIRSYIERGLLPSAQSRGRAASYLPDHLDRLRVIKTLRRAWPNLTLAEIRIRLQQLTPENIRARADGRIAAQPVTAVAGSRDEMKLLDEDDLDEEEIDREEGISPRLDLPVAQLAGAQRLVHALRNVTGFVTAGPASKAETSQRIAVTEDIELSVRGGFSPAQLTAFRELADLLRDALTRADAIPSQPKRDELSPEADA
jgi:DNA-binding transcriptional MerR regulator